MSHFSWWIDGSIIGVYLLITMAAGIFVKKYVGKVDDFLVAGREMDVYLGIASLAATEFGIVTCMYEAEYCYLHGFSGVIPGVAQAVAMLIIGLTGFCIKPLRDSGVLTIPQLFEKRFGKGVRWAAGVVIVLGGLLNMGVFLRLGGDFLVRVTGINQSVFPLEWMMTIMLVMVAVYTILGGMLSVLVTDFLQFIVMSVGLIVVTILILKNVGWDSLASASMNIHYKDGTPLGEGAFNPLANRELGWPYIIYQLLIQTAATLTWQTTIARVLSAKDTATGRKVYTRTSFFFVCRSLMPGIWGIAAAGAVAAGTITLAKTDTSIHAMPIFLGQFVPIGVMGILIAAMLAADMSTDSSYMLTWGSVIYNDILSPFHKGRFSERLGLAINRSLVALIGVFLLFYGLWFKIEGNAWDYLTMTGTIYLASMAALLIACCYWKGANSWGGYAAIFVGAIIPTVFLILQQAEAGYWASFDPEKEQASQAAIALGEWSYNMSLRFNPNAKGMAAMIGTFYSGIAAYVGAGLAMVIGSLLKSWLSPSPPTAPASEGR